MINRIIDFSVNNKFIVFALVAVACVSGWWSMKHMALDAIPDLSDTQVIIYSRWDRSPDLVEDQVTYPIVTTMVGAPKVKAVRGFSDFGYSYVYVIFEDGTDIYWARSRTQEYLSAVLPRLPEGAKTEIGPDATPLGWIFQYALVDESGKNSLADLRTYQDFYLKYYLRAVPGVAEVAPVGGFGKQYQVNVDPNRLQAFGLSINQVVQAVKDGNYESAGRLIEFGGTEYSVRGRGYVQSVQDIEKIAVSASDSGTPIRIKDIGQVVLGPDIRRGVADLDGKGDVVSGIVVMRYGQNALDVIQRVKAKLKEIEPGLPDGVKVVPVYDRSDLILRAIDNLKSTVVEVLITVALVVFLFLWHIPSALIPVITLPVAILISFIPFKMLGVTANIMSLGGIAIAIGAMVDASIVVVEQTHKNLEQWDKRGPEGKLPRRGHPRRKAGGRPQLFRPAGDCRLLSSHSHPGSPGRPAFQAIGLYQDPGHDHCRRAGDYVGSGTEAFFHPHEEFQFPAPLAVRHRQHAVRRNGSFGRETPHQPFFDPDLQPRGGLVAALEMGGDRRRSRSDDRNGAGLFQAGLGIHAAPGGGVHPLHAHDHAGHLHHRGRKSTSGHGPDHQTVPGSEDRARESGKGRDVHRPGAAVHAGNRDHPQTQGRMAQNRYLVFLLGPGMGQDAVSSYHAGSHFPAGTDQPDERCTQDPRAGQLVDHAHQGQVRHVEHRASHPGGTQDHRCGPRCHRKNRNPDRIPVAVR